MLFRSEPSPSTAFVSLTPTKNHLILNVLEQAGANVTAGYEGGIDAVGGGRQRRKSQFY